MEAVYKQDFDGQAVQKEDLELLGETAGLADDRVFAELFRLQPYDGSTVSRAVIPPSNGAIVAPNGASGSVLVNPFRALIGSRTAAATDAKANLRDIRSAICVGSTALAQTVNIAANASGNPRWDLIYASVAVDANATSVERKVKSTTTGVVSTQPVTLTKVTQVTLGVVQGTAAASPTWPSAPSDGGGTYVIPLAYVRVPDEFNATSTVLPTDIALQAPILSVGPHLGTNIVRPADGAYAVSSAEQQSWGATGTRKPTWMPPDMCGTESLLVVLDFSAASSANWSHLNNGVVDSRDWRDRLCRYTAIVSNIGATSLGSSLPWNMTSGTGLFHSGQNRAVAVISNDDAYVAMGFGQTFVDHAADGGTANRSNVMQLLGNRFQEMADGAEIKLYVDHADGGKLKVNVTGAPSTVVFAWIDFTKPYNNS